LIGHRALVEVVHQSIAVDYATPYHLK